MKLDLGSLICYQIWFVIEELINFSSIYDFRK